MRAEELSQLSINYTALAINYTALALYSASAYAQRNNNQGTPQHCLAPPNFFFLLCKPVGGRSSHTRRG